MLNKDITQGGWWEKIKGFARAHIGLTVIIVAALLLQLTTAVMYYTAENIIQHTMEQLVEREMNAVYMSITIWRGWSATTWKTQTTCLC